MKEATYPTASSFVSFFTERRCVHCRAAFVPERELAGLQSFFSLQFLFRKQRASDFFCPDCLPRLPRIGEAACPLCGEPCGVGGVAGGLCGSCLSERPPWERAVFYGEYQGLLRDMLVGLKFHNQLAYARALGLLLASCFELHERRFDVVVPVPLHEKRLGKRGFNQALEIAGPLAATLRTPLSSGGLRRIKMTVPQTGLTRSERGDNIKGAFSASGGLRAKNILLVDDVMTTGATMKAAASALFASGVASVTVGAVARVAVER